MELEESLLRLRESLGKWSLKVRISPLKAAEYRKSAGKGKIEYELAVGFMCVCGRKAERSQEEALGWLRKAAESRGGRMKPMVRHARLMIGDMYHEETECGRTAWRPLNGTSPRRSSLNRMTSGTPVSP